MNTSCGAAFLHHVCKDPIVGDVVAVHRCERIPTSDDELKSDVFSLGFPIGTARRAGVCSKVGRATIPQKFLSGRFRYPFHSITGGTLLYWVLIENGKERRGLKTLSPEEMTLPLAVAVNFAKMEELICIGYRGEAYIP